MTKVVLVNLWRVINAYGGTEKVFFSLANALATRGYDVTAIASDRNDGTIHFPISEKVTFKNCVVSDVKKPILNLLSFYLPTKQLRDRKRFTLLLKNKANAIGQEIKKINPDVIISFQQETTFMLKEIIGAKQTVITMFHGKPSCYFNGAKFNFCKSALEKSEYCQVLMPEYISELTANFRPNKVVYIPNAIPQFKSKAPLEKHTIINIARVSREKRLHLLIEAFALLKDKYPDWKLEFWGEENYDRIYSQELKKLIHIHELDSQVSFCGVTNNIEEKLEESSIFVLPSEIEGFPLALGEAMSKGIPAVGCKSCSAVNSLIKHKYSGLLCDDTPTDMAIKIEQLIKSHNLRLEYGKNAKNQMQAYADDIVWEQWGKLIDSLTNKS